jgi:hypothetical protein
MAQLVGIYLYCHDRRMVRFLVDGLDGIARENGM